MGLFGKVAMSGSDAINNIVNLLANGKAGNTVVNYPDDLISQVPYDLRKEVALHNESILGSSYREGMQSSPTYYHGTGADNITAMRETENGKAGEGGVYFTNSAGRASKYAGLAGDLRRGASPNIIPAKLNISNPYISTTGMPYNNDVSSLKAEGYDGIILKGEMPDGGDEVIAFSPSQTRVPNAVFDPAKTGSSNLLASNPVATTGAGLLGLGAIASSDDADAGVVSKSLASITKDAEKQGVKLDIFESKKGLELSKIVVPEKSKGVGTSIMNDLADYADQTGQTVSLSPSTDFGGTSKKRLSEFYKRFGFVQNKGKNKDFTISNSMYRSPSSVVKAAAPVGTGLLGLGAAAQSNDTYADYSPSNLARLRSDDVGGYQAPQSMAASNIAGLMGSINKVGYDDPLLGMVASQLPSELMNKIAYNDKRGLLDYAKAYAGLLGF